MTKRTSDWVELHLFLMKSEEIVLETVQAKDWGEFIVAGIDSSKITPEEYDKTTDTLELLGQKLNKTFVLLPTNVDLRFAGLNVRIEDSDEEKEDRRLELGESTSPES